MRGIRTYLLTIFKLFIIVVVLLQIYVLYNTRSDDTVHLLLRNMYETRFNISQTSESIEAHNSSYVFEISRQSMDLKEKTPNLTSRPDEKRNIN